MEARDWVLLAMFFVMILQVYVILSLQADVQQMNSDLTTLWADMYASLELLTQEVFKK